MGMGRIIYRVYRLWSPVCDYFVGNKMIYKSYTHTHHTHCVVDVVDVNAVLHPFNSSISTIPFVLIARECIFISLYLTISQEQHFEFIAHKDVLTFSERDDIEYSNKFMCVTDLAYTLHMRYDTHQHITCLHLRRSNFTVLPWENSVWIIFSNEKCSNFRWRKVSVCDIRRSYAPRSHTRASIYRVVKCYQTKTKVNKKGEKKIHSKNQIDVIAHCSAQSSVHWTSRLNFVCIGGENKLFSQINYRKTPNERMKNSGNFR